ncbi:MAG: tetratricopeptide repeat protein [Puniceicoccaceae bacterium]
MSKEAGKRRLPNQTGSRTMTARRMWVMRLTAAVLIPALFIGILEIGLRLAGSGHPTSFFVSRKVGKESYYFTNQKFTFRFFPKALARSVIPYRIKAEKPDNTFRIFIFGESAANGDPDAAYSFGRHLKVLLEERFPQTDFEVLTTAITAVNSHVILPIALDCAKRDGDLWIVYMGNNEMVGPYGAMTVFGSKAPALPLIRAGITAKSFRIGQLLQYASEGMSSGSPQQQTWGGINMFADNLLHIDDPSRQRVYRNFRDNLESILKAGKRAEVPVLLSTVVSNLRDCGPFASLHRTGLTPSDLSTWNAHFEKAKELEAAGNYNEALKLYVEAAAIDPSHAELQFRIGRSHGILGNLESSKEALTLARDADGLAVRADSTINKIIREASSTETDGSVILVDSEALVSAQSPGGIPGREFFYEHVHFTLQGNYLMARIFGEELLDLLPPEIRERDTGRWISPENCQEWLAATSWDKERLWSEMFARQNSPPYEARPFNYFSLSNCQNAATAYREIINSQADRRLYESAIKRYAEDYHLRSAFGNYLQLNNAIPEAIEQFQWITGNFPEFEGGHQELALALFLAERYDEARESFKRVLEINPDYAKASKGLELIDSRQN